MNVKVQRFRKNPVEIEAMQWDGTHESACQIVTWVQSKKHSLTTAHYETDYMENGAVVIKTLEGDMRANPCDWIIRGVANEFYPCRDDIFRATYEVVL